MVAPITPGGATAFGSHFLSTWDLCERKGYFSFEAPHPAGGKGLRTKFPPGPVRLGGIVHEGMAAYYLSGPEDHTKRDVDYAVAVLEAAAAARAHEWFTSEEREADLAKGRGLLYDYHQFYKGDPDIVVCSDADGPLVEREWQVEIPGCPTPFTCRPDLVATWQGQWVYVLEHKTTSAYGLNRLRASMRNSIQGTGECYVLSRVLPHLPIQGVMLNCLLKDRSSKSKYGACERDTVARTQAQLQMFEHHVRQRHHQRAALALQYDVLLEKLGDPWEAAAHVYVARGTSTGACENQYGRPCEFLDICVGRGLEQVLAQGYVARANNPPLDSHDD